MGRFNEFVATVDCRNCEFSGEVILQAYVGRLDEQRYRPGEIPGRISKTYREDIGPEEITLYLYTPFLSPCVFYATGLGACPNCETDIYEKLIFEDWTYQGTIARQLPGVEVSGEEYTGWLDIYASTDAGVQPRYRFVDQLLKAEKAQKRAFAAVLVMCFTQALVRYISESEIVHQAIIYPPLWQNSISKRLLHYRETFLEVALDPKQTIKEEQVSEVTIWSELLGQLPATENPIQNVFRTSLFVFSNAHKYLLTHEVNYLIACFYHIVKLFETHAAPSRSPAQIEKTIHLLCQLSSRTINTRRQVLQAVEELGMKNLLTTG